ncbi:MAG: polyisoprenoid-binding protein YceI [Bermanella sp.]|jgi:polyisoprenoid-binding protein YceI
MKKPLLIVATAVAALTLSACSDSSNNQTSASTKAAPAKTLKISAPTAEYANDPYHSSLSFSVTHIGLANYVMRFTDFSAALTLNSENISKSSIALDINPVSITTDFDGDYTATHKQSQFKTWEAELAHNPKFLNASEHPNIRFNSTEVSPNSDGTLTVIGDLTLLGQTHPVTLNASLVGDVEKHPFFGFGALGFSARGSFNRSEFGMTHLTQPPLVGDKVTIVFEGEFHRVVDKPTQ